MSTINPSLGFCGWNAWSKFDKYFNANCSAGCGRMVDVDKADYSVI